MSAVNVLHLEGSAESKIKLSVVHLFGQPAGEEEGHTAQARRSRHEQRQHQHRAPVDVQPYLCTTEMVRFTSVRGGWWVPPRGGGGPLPS